MTIKLLKTKEINICGKKFVIETKNGSTKHELNVVFNYSSEYNEWLFITDVVDGISYVELKELLKISKQLNKR